MQTHLAFGGGRGIWQQCGQGVQHGLRGETEAVPVPKDPCEGQREALPRALDTNIVRGKSIHA